MHRSCRMSSTTRCLQDMLTLLLVIAVLSTLLVSIVFCCCVWLYLKLCVNPFVRPARPREDVFKAKPNGRRSHQEYEMEEIGGRTNPALDRGETGKSRTSHFLFCLRKGKCHSWFHICISVRNYKIILESFI